MSSAELPARRLFANSWLLSLAAVTIALWAIPYSFLEGEIFRVVLGLPVSSTLLALGDFGVAAGFGLLGLHLWALDEREATLFAFITLTYCLIGLTRLIF